MKTITIVEVLDALKQARDERGANFHYSDEFGTEACVYVMNDEPACIAGNALNRLGVSIDILKSLDDLRVAIVESEKFKVTLERAGFVLEQDAEKALAIAQLYQDRGYSWGESYDDAWTVVR